MNYRNAWPHGTQTRKPRPKGKAHDPWEYNTIPWADREWMKQGQSDLDKAALSRSITGGFEADNDD